MQPRVGTEAYDLLIAMASLRGRLNRNRKVATNVPRQKTAWLGHYIPHYDKAEAQEGGLV
jgi:hypothetical protein